MNKTIKISCLFFLFIGCKSSHLVNISPGEYYSNGKDYSYNLILRNDNSFVLQLKYQDTNPKCEGTWKRINKMKIDLKCEEETSIGEMLSNGYMNIREHELIVISKRKLKFNGVILKKKK